MSERDLETLAMLSMPAEELVRIIRRDVLEVQIAEWRFRVLTWRALVGGLSALVDIFVSW